MLLLTLLITLALAGAVMTAHGVHVMFAGTGAPRAGADGTNQVLNLVAGGREVLTGFCLTLGCAAVATDNHTLLVAALVIGLEELYETTMALALLRRIHENEANPAI